jgi:hypothetical protein
LTKFFAFLTLSASAVLLTGCSLFYPNWGATSLPEEPAGETTATETATETPSETQAPTETETAEPEPTESETQKPEPKKTDVEIIMAVAEPDFGVLTVVARMPSVIDTGGTCTVRYQYGTFDKKFNVKAEPSADYTQCHPIEIPLKELVAGEGIVTVSYSSDNYVGTSAASSVVIP